MSSPMTEDCAAMAVCIAANLTVSENELWHTSETVDGAIGILERKRKPIPIDLVFARSR